MDNKLTGIEWETCWMAIRYAMGRQTIASATLPADLIRAYKDRWTQDQLDSIYVDLKRHEEMHDTFGHKDIDNIHWQKFKEYCNKSNRHLVTTTDGKDRVCFKVDNRFYDVQSYMNMPRQEIYIPEENIKKIV